MVLVEIHRFWLQKYPHTGEEMALTDTFVKNTKHTGWLTPLVSKY
jgi:hypothetical protein